MTSLHVTVHDQTLSAPSRPLHRGSGCHECRRRKLKCSGTKPACDRCVRSGTQCLYDPVEKSKVALLRDEVVMLRERVKVLEAVAMSPTTPERPPSRGYHPPHVYATEAPRQNSWRVALSAEDQYELFTQFMAVQHIANEFVSIPPNPHPPTAPYAAKTSAYLFASYFSPRLHTLKSNLLEHTRHCIDEAMRHANRSHDPAPIVLDAIHAFSLLAAGMLVDEKLVECQQALFSAAKLAILSGLHQLRSLAISSASNSPVDERPSGMIPPPTPTTMIPPPTSEADVRRRVGVFWQLLCLDYTAAIIMDPSVPVSLPWEDCPAEVQVETVWPDFSAGRKEESIASLFTSSQAPASAGSHLEEGVGGVLRVKAIVLLERAVRVSAQRERGSSRYSAPVEGSGDRSPLGKGERSPLGKGEVCSSRPSTGFRERSPLGVRDKSPLGLVARDMSPLRRGDVSPIRLGGRSPLAHGETLSLGVGDKSPAGLSAEDRSPLGRGDKSPLSRVDSSSLALSDRSPVSPRHPPSRRQTSPAVALRSAIKETDNAISNVLEQIPITSPKSRAASLAPHTLLLCARVRLHESLAAKDNVSQLVWVQSAVAIVRLLDGMDLEEVGKGADLLMAYAWITSHAVLLHEHTYVPYLPESEHAVRIRSDLERLRGLIEGVGKRMGVVATMFRSAVDKFYAQRKPISPRATPPESADMKMEDDESDRSSSGSDGSLKRRRPNDPDTPNKRNSPESRDARDERSTTVGREESMEDDEQDELADDN